jgi:hypothetical protein
MYPKTAQPATCSETEQEGLQPEGSGFSAQQNMAVPPAMLSQQKANEQSLLVDYQMDLLLENIFPPKFAKTKGTPANWMDVQND